jgi:hypothetical protein
MGFSRHLARGHIGFSLAQVQHSRATPSTSISPPSPSELEGPHRRSSLGAIRIHFRILSPEIAVQWRELPRSAPASPVPATPASSYLCLSPSFTAQFKRATVGTDDAGLRCKEAKPSKRVFCDNQPALGHPLPHCPTELAGPAAESIRPCLHHPRALLYMWFISSSERRSHPHGSWIRRYGL